MSWTRGRPTLDRGTRARTLAKHPVCQCKGCDKCPPSGCQRPSTIDDHIKPWAEGGSDADWNHQGMCAPCHEVKTKQEAARGQARRPRARRAPEQHPGLA